MVEKIQNESLLRKTGEGSENNWGALASIKAAAQLLWVNSVSNLYFGFLHCLMSPAFKCPIFETIFSIFSP